MRRPSYINHWIFRVVPGFFDLVYLLQFVIWLRHAWQRGVHLHVVALLACPGLLLLFAAYKAAHRQFGWALAARGGGRGDDHSNSESGREQIAQSAITRSLVLGAGHLR
jgi:hypothetical protein